MIGCSEQGRLGASFGSGRRPERWDGDTEKLWIPGVPGVSAAAPHGVLDGLSLSQRLADRLPQFRVLGSWGGDLVPGVELGGRGPQTPALPGVTSKWLTHPSGLVVIAFLFYFIFFNVQDPAAFVMDNTDPEDKPDL